MTGNNAKENLENYIARYRAILFRDPSSTIFAALAESLRRLGQFDEAIKVSLEGLKIHPNHISARVALARTYYDKGLLREAKTELEKIVKDTPDNLLTQKLLKEISDKTALCSPGNHTVEKELQEPVEEAVIEGDDSEEEWLAGDGDKFYTLTMAEILERQGLKKDAMKIYQVLLKKEGQNCHMIRARIERLKGPSFQAHEDRERDFVNWVDKLQRGVV